MIRVSELKLPVTGNQKALEKKLAKALRVPVEEIKAYRIFKRSLDARKKDNIHYAYVVDAEVKNENKILEKNKDKHIAKGGKSPDKASRCGWLRACGHVCCLAFGGNGLKAYCTGAWR